MYANNYFLAHHEGNEAKRVLMFGSDGPYLSHHQVKGGRWGIRRYQNYDGSLTPLGREHYGVGPERGNESEKKDGKTDIRIGKDVTEVGSIKKSGVNVTINGKQLSGIRANIHQKLQQHSENRAKASAEKAVAKEQKRQEEEAKKESERLAKEAIAEAERKKQEELEADKEKAAREALKNYYREHPLQIYSARDILTPDEMKEVQDKIVMDRQLKDFRRDEIMRYVKTAKDVADTIDTVYKGADSLKKLYNVGAETYNSLIAAKDPNDDKKPMRIIGKDTYKPKTPTDVSTAKKNDQNGNDSKAEGEEGKKDASTNSADKQSGNKSDKKAKQDTSKTTDTSSLKKEMADKERSSSSNAQSEKAKKGYEKLKQDTEKKENAKYIEKIGDRYFYDKDELKAYKDSSDLASKAKAAYSKADDRARLKFHRDMDDLIEKRVESNNWSSADRGKYMAIIDAIYGNDDELEHSDIDDTNDGLISLDDFLQTIGGANK